MKIAFIINGFPNVTETFILNQITGLIDLGNEVEIFAKRIPKPKKVHPDVEKYKLMKFVHYRPKLPASKNICRIKAFFYICFHLLISPLRTMKLLRYFQNNTNNFNYEILFFSFPFIRKKFDIIHCHYGPSGIYGLFLKTSGIQDKISTVFHGYDMSLYPRIKGEEVYGELLKKGDLFLPISDYWKEKLIKMGGYREKIFVHHMGIDIKRFECVERNRENCESIRILTIGRLTEKKGYEYSIKAVAGLKKDQYSIEYIIAGDGPLKEKLVSLTSKLEINDNVKFLGAVNQDDVIKLYEQADIFLLASVMAESGDMEGIPVVIMEALAAEIPVISTYHSGIPEIVIDGKSGYLVPERDIDALIEKLEYLIKNPDERIQMGKQGREYVENNFNIVSLNNKLEKLFQNML